jgi:hypothetical protein
LIAASGVAHSNCQSAVFAVRCTSKANPDFMWSS